MPNQAALLEKARQFLAMAQTARDPVLHYTLLELAARHVQLVVEMERKEAGSSSDEPPPQ